MLAPQLVCRRSGTPLKRRRTSWWRRAVGDRVGAIQNASAKQRRLQRLARGRRHATKVAGKTAPSTLVVTDPNTSASCLIDDDDDDAEEEVEPRSSASNDDVESKVRCRRKTEWLPLSQAFARLTRSTREGQVFIYFRRGGELLSFFAFSFAVCALKSVNETSLAL